MRCNDCITYEIGMRKCFISTSVLYYLCSTLPQCYRKNELEIRVYEQRVREMEHSSSPLVLFSHRRHWYHHNCCVKEAGLCLGKETVKTIQLNVALAKMQTELPVAEISRNVHSGLNNLHPRHYILTHGVH